MPEIDPRYVRRRFEFILEVCANDSVAQMNRDTGLPRNVINHALSRERQNLSVASAALLHDAYGVDLNFLYLGDRRLLPDRLQVELDHWIATGRWDLEHKAPKCDRVPRRKPKNKING